MKKIILLIIFIFSLILFSGCEKDDFDASLEPPLSKVILTMAVPDFLTEELQLLYRRAYSVYNALGWMSTDIEYGDSVEDYKFEPEKVTIDGVTYLISPYGKFTKYTHFDRLIKSIFTEKYWDTENIFTFKNSTFKRFTNCGGSLCYIERERGGSLWRNYEFADTFELISSNESKIEFYVVGYYSYRYFINDSETIKEREKRLTENYEYIEKHLIRMVLTQDGWRVDAFENTGSDEGNYNGTYSFLH